MEDYEEARNLLSRETGLGRDLLGYHAERAIRAYQHQIEESKKT